MEHVRPTSPLDRLGSKFIRFVADMAGIWGLSIVSIREAFRAPRQAQICIHHVWLEQMKFTGVDAVPLTCAAGVIVGAIVTIQSMAILPQVGAADSLGKLMTMIVIRELGPLLVAFIVIGRSATAVSVELGTMVFGEELVALRTLGIPLRPYVVFPRIAGVTASTIGLLIYFDLAAVVGGYLVSYLLLHLSPGFFLNSLAHHIAPMDLVATMAKGFLFGAIIASIACYFGLSVKRSPTEIPQVAMRAVVTAIFFCLCADLILSFGFLQL
jgi:phospholipid/cholesterol/gamma-HCH transport system permease protein